MYFLLCFPLPESDAKYYLTLISTRLTVFILTQTLFCGFLLFIVSVVDIYVNLYIDACDSINYLECHLNDH